MRIDAIEAGDIVKASIGGRTVYGEVLEIRDRVVHFIPLSRAAGWRHATANQIIGHWRKAGTLGLDHARAERMRRPRGVAPDDDVLAQMDEPC